ncbi:MAG: hypothetical protein A2Y93_10795 [Chloroflexi bacterium RBG_13_68_17]|nr:MAG: hypothetical protein A2Y93_10795 [Chloroflexi bacterium RBG_13_68_17]
MMDSQAALKLARQTITRQAECLRELSEGLDDRLWEVARLIVDRPGIVWVTGVGTSAAIGLRFAHILTDCGVRSIFLSPDMGLHGHSGALAAGEILLAVSRGGESREVNQMVEIANKRGLTTVALVHDTDSTLAHSCAMVLPVRSPKDYELGGYVATTSTVMACGMCDAVASIVLQLTGYTAEDLRLTHPGGAVGQVLGDPDRQPS